MSTPGSDKPDPGDPGERTDKDAQTPGTGKQFAQNVHSPDDADTRPGSGKQFSPTDARREDDDPDEDDAGSGKQFAPGHHDQ